jgi:cell division initiation protein
MDTPQANDQAGGVKPVNKPSIDSLRTVEFRMTLRGYHMDDVDEYLERVAVEAEELQEQTRLSAERLKQAADRVSALELQLEQARKTQHVPQGPATEVVERVEVADDSLQRTLLLAQKFVDQTKQQAEEEANALVSESETRARNIVADAEEHARVLTEDAERKLRDEVKRLDQLRSELVGDVETIAKHLESERARIRKALTDMVDWVDEHVQAPKSPGTHQSSERKQRAPDESPSETPSPRPRADHVAPETRGSGGASDSKPAGAAAEAIEQPGQPTELVQVTHGVKSRVDPDDPSDLFDAAPDVESETDTVGSSSARTPGHQRQMFAPGRDTSQAGRGAAR